MQLGDKIEPKICSIAVKKDLWYTHVLFHFTVTDFNVMCEMTSNFLLAILQFVESIALEV